MTHVTDDSWCQCWEDVADVVDEMVLDVEDEDRLDGELF